MQLAHPQYLWLFIAYVPLIIWYVMKQHNARPYMAMSTTAPFAKLPASWRQYMRHLLFALRLAAVGCLIIVLARPQLKDNWRTTHTEGTDIMIALDISSSMLARDFNPDRLEAAKSVAAKFVSGREDDNIGVVVFAGESLTGVPMTVDRIATSLNRLKEGKAKSKSIILLTDGSNNTGVVTPLDATRVAQELGVKIYTIGIGTNGEAPSPMLNEFGRMVFAPQKVVIDEATLRTVAESTGGKYFRATGNKVLQQVFDEIDALEKTQMDVRHFSHTEDNYMLWAWLAFAFVALELLLRYTVVRTMP